MKVAQLCPTLWPQFPYSPWNSPGQNTGGGSCSLLQGIFPTQGLNPGLPHCRRILQQLSHQGSPRILERVAYPFSRGLPDPGIKPGSNQCRVSCIAGGFFTNWAIWEALDKVKAYKFSITPWILTCSLFSNGALNPLPTKFFPFFHMYGL